MIGIFFTYFNPHQNNKGKKDLPLHNPRKTTQ